METDDGGSDSQMRSGDGESQGRQGNSHSALGNGEPPRMDCVIPLHRKDNKPFRLCIEGVSRHVQHLGDIVVVTARNNIEQLSTLDVPYRVIEEEEFAKTLSFGPRELRDRPHQWILQQFIKLQAHEHVSTSHYSVVDSDTVYLRPIDYWPNGRLRFICNELYSRMDHPCCLDYCQSVHDLLGWQPAHREACFIAHQMVFCVDEVRRLLAGFPDRPWWGFIHRIGARELYVKFAEYETYGHHYLRRHPDGVVLDTDPVWREIPWRWWEDEEHTNRLFEVVKGRGYEFATFHAYLRSTALTPEQVITCLEETESNEDLFYWMHEHFPQYLRDEAQFPARYYDWVTGHPR